MTFEAEAEQITADQVVRAAPRGRAGALSVFGLFRAPPGLRPAPPPPAEEVGELVRRLEIRARKLMENRALGAYDAVFRGHGIEFAEVREYEPGDPFNAIDWKVTARTGRPFVKRFVEERELNVVLAVDVSGSAAFGTRGPHEA